MFTLNTDSYSKDCEGHTRRSFLRVGSLGMAGLTLPHYLATKAKAGQDLMPGVRDKAVVVLFLQGGPTHIETFDPKMTAPAEYRAMFGEVKTNLPGVTFGSHFPKLASMADKLAIVRSFKHGNSSHASASQLVISGGNLLQAAMGSLYSRVAGISSSSGIPINAVLAPPSAGAKYKNLGAQTTRVTSVGQLPPAYKAFDPSSGSQILQNMEMRIASNRLGDRKTLLGKLDRLRRQADASGSIEGADEFQQQAFDVIMNGAGQAFDLSKEDATTLARYDTSKFAIPKSLYKKKNKNLLKQSPIALGKQMVMARRLVEAGCRFVTVTSAGWDMHGNAFGVNDGMPLLGPAVDTVASAFIEDLAARGLSEKVLFIITGEFGRTPRINKKGGRDHWGNLCTLALSGGGLKMGQVVGESDKRASVPATKPITTQNLKATVMNTLFDIGTLRFQSGVSRDVFNAVSSGQPIKELM